MEREYITKIDCQFKLGLPEVVRCKDCKHRPTYPEAYGAEIDGKWCYWCEQLRAWKHDDWFCADGDRKDGEVK